MSDIKVNGNTYTGIETLRFMKADDSGYAEYKEGAEAAEDFRDRLVTGGYDVGDYESDHASPYIGWLTNLGGGTISFPYATAANGAVTDAVFDNLLLPNVVSMTTHKAPNNSYPAASSFQSITVNETLDLGSLTSIQNANMTFKGAKIGTLKLGALPAHNMMFYNATITNLLWNVPAATVTDSTMPTYLNGATSITNLYVPADRVEAIRTLVTDGTITKVTNVYSIDDWED